MTGRHGYDIKEEAFTADYTGITTRGVLALFDSLKLESDFTTEITW